MNPIVPIVALVATLFVLSALLRAVLSPAYRAVNLVAMGVIFILSVVVAYVAGNLVEGMSFAEIRKNLRSGGLNTVMIFVGLVILALAAWVVFQTPIWALVIIVLLFLILVRLCLRSS